MRFLRGGGLGHEAREILVVIALLSVVSCVDKLNVKHVSKLEVYSRTGSRRRS